jgi:hypothetical protein
MKVYVEIGAWVDVKEGEEVLETLKKIHESDAEALGTSAQYEEAAKSVENALGIMFYDYERDGSEYQGLRIVRVSDEEVETVLVES